MAFSGMTTKLKFGLIFSVSCAFTYITLVYVSNSMNLGTFSQNAILKVMPEQVRESSAVKKLSDYMDDYFEENLPPPPVKPSERKEAQGNEEEPEVKAAESKTLLRDEEKRQQTQNREKEAEVKVETSKSMVDDEEKKQQTDGEKKELQETKADFDASKMVEQSKDEAKDRPEDDSKSHNLIFKGVSKFPEALAKVASPERAVLLTLVDHAFHAMAINFYLTCIKPFEITNYIILTMHPDTCEVLETHGINCFFYRDIRKGETASSWGTQIFKDKMNVRTEFIIEALKGNFSVLHTDIDVYCFKNIMKSVECPRQSCDIAPLMDSSAYNAGFLMINPSQASIKVYERMTEIARKSPTTDDQAQLNSAMNRQRKEPGGLKIKRLPKDAYICGLSYYESPHRYFADTAKPCPTCIVVHNNWIVSMEAKIYRAKEMHQWVYNGDKGGYYMDPDAKYIRYQNTLPHDHDQAALKAALAIAKVLNRTLILPTFSSKKNIPTPLNAFLHVATFDKEFQGKYREHSFSTHPLVPDSVKSSLSRLYVIASDIISTKSPEILTKEGVKVLTPKDPVRGMNDEEIIEHFKDVKESILEFHAMYNGFSSFINPEKQKAWEAKCKKGLKSSQYRQYR